LNQRQIQALGYCGLIPFYGCAVLAYRSDQPDFWIFSIHAYAGLIVAFLGAISWGLELSSREMPASQRQWLVYWGVIPAILGWVCIILPQEMRLGPLVALFAMTLAVDAYIHQKQALPAFWLTLRVRLTFGVILALMLAEFVH
jgi:hypothetical protein